jgi:adenosine kinase
MSPVNDRQIVVAGSLAYDNIMDFPGLFKDHILPEKIDSINLSFLVTDLKRQRGGCAANIAYSIALLGGRARIVAAAGHDFDEYAAWLEGEGIDIGGLHRFNDLATASCFVTSDQSSNQIVGFYPGAMGQAGTISMAESAGDRAEMCIVAPDDPAAMLRHCREAKTAGIPLVFDPSFQVIHLSGEDLWEAMKGARIVMLNDYEFAVLKEKTGKTEEEMLEEIEILVVTLGSKGSSIRTLDGHIQVPACEISGMVDPTGAGDSYRAGFLTGLSEGRELEICGRMGSVASAYVVERYGTQSHRYSREEFEARYQKNFGVPLDS